MQIVDEYGDVFKGFGQFVLALNLEVDESVKPGPTQRTPSKAGTKGNIGESKRTHSLGQLHCRRKETHWKRMSGPPSTQQSSKAVLSTNDGHILPDLSKAKVFFKIVYSN